jgi:diguanylate cyclase (GGDEF)-like protein
MRNRRRTTLEAKLCLLTMALMFAVLLGVGHYSMSQQRKVLVEQQHEAFDGLARAIVLVSEPIVATGDSSIGQRVLASLNKADLKVDYILVSDGAGKPIFAQSRRVSAERGRFAFAKRARQIAGYVTGYDASDESIYRTSLPIQISQGRWGTVAVGFSMDSVNRSIDELQSKVLLVFTLAFLIGIAGAVVMARSISGQLKKLIEAAGAVAGGDLSRGVPEDSGDEVGDLCRGFNTMVHALRDSRDKLVERANTDSLTDLYNHRYFQERLAAEISRASRYKHVLSVLMVDIDHFKALNDQHGHPSGDRALREIAGIMRSVMRDMDVVARYGGEEFSIILPETAADEAFAAAERIRTAVQKHCFYGKDGETVPLTVSVGAAQYPAHSMEREGLIMAADMALYRAKSTGRNRTCRFEQELKDNPAGDPYNVHVLLRATDLRTVESIAAAIDAKHRFAPGHGIVVADQAARLANALGMSREEVDSVRIASLLRDVGQLGLPDSMLAKRESLSSEDREAVSSHPTLGHTIVQKSPGLKSMLPGILHHHENYDGTGYPFGLAGDDIPLVARVIAVADAYYSMISDRPHRDRLDEGSARAELKRCSCHQFDPVVVDVFLKLMDEQARGGLAA